MALFISGDQLYARTQDGRLFNMERPTEPLLMVGEELPCGRWPHARPSGVERV